MKIVDFEMPIVDAVPWMHPESAGKFIFTADLVRHADVMESFRRRLAKMIHRLSAPQRDTNDGPLIRLTPVLYVCREVFFALESWTDMEMTTVDGLDGIVYKTIFRGLSLIIIHGKHPSPRGWAGIGRYREYHFFLDVFEGCLRSPDDPVTALAQINAEELIRVQAVHAFFEGKQVPVDKMMVLRPSCLHRFLECLRLSWDAIQDTIDKIAPTMTEKLPPELMALLSLQMDDIENIAAAITRFGTNLEGRISLTSPGEVYGLMTAVVKHSNALAFRVDSELATSIETRVDRLFSSIRETLGVSDARLVAVLKGVTAEATREDSFQLIAHNMRDHPVEDWAKILSTPGAVKTISRGKLVQVTAAIKDHGFPFEHWTGLLSTNGAINAIARGALDKVAAALKNHGFPFELWTGLLSTGGAINAIAGGALDKVAAALKEAKVPFHEWVKILKTGGAITAIGGEKFSDVVTALRLSGIREDQWGWMLNHLVS